MVDKGKLNRKLAEWAGWKIISSEADGDSRQSGVTIYFCDPDGLPGDYPEFTASLDACFTWLVPKLQPKTLMMETFWDDDGIWKYEWSILSDQSSGGVWSAYGVEPALDLCLAIEQLIDQEKTDEEAK